MKAIIDTNVPIVANDRETAQASATCVRNCAVFLNEFTKGEENKLVLDSAWQIIKEYRNKLNSSGEPGVGDSFLKWVLTNWDNPDRCELVEITPIRIDNKPSYKEFPNDDIALSKFDISDRKFVAVALTHNENPTIYNAVDTDWCNAAETLALYNIKIEFLCWEIT